MMLRRFKIEFIGLILWERWWAFGCDESRILLDQPNNYKLFSYVI